MCSDLDKYRIQCELGGEAGTTCRSDLGCLGAFSQRMLEFLSERCRVLTLFEDSAHVRTSLGKEWKVSMTDSPVTEVMPGPQESSLRGASVKFLR